MILLKVSPIFYIDVDLFLISNKLSNLKLQKEFHYNVPLKFQLL